MIKAMSTSKSSMGLIALLGVLFGVFAIQISAYAELYFYYLLDYFRLSEGRDALIFQAYFVGLLSMLPPALIFMMPIGFFWRSFAVRSALFAGMTGALTILAVGLVGGLAINFAFVVEALALIPFAAFGFYLGSILRRRTTRQQVLHE